MDDSIFTVALDHPSAEGNTMLHAVMWTSRELGVRAGEGATAPRGIVQITHGMAEYIERYDEFARFLVGKGFVVVGQDMVGHGHSVASPDELGHIPVSFGAEGLLSDMHTLRALASECFPEAPYFMFGHSMGSFMTRCYLARYAEGLAGAIICGTGHVPPALCRFGAALARSIAKRKGQTTCSPFIDSMGAGGYGKKIKGARTELDWLSFDDANVDAYIADPLCGQMFSVGGYAALLDLTAESSDAACAKRYPADLPMLFIAGVGDPVGDFGKGVQTAADMVRSARSASADAAGVAVIVYENARHEILNEAIRETVFADVAAWLETQI